MGTITCKGKFSCGVVKPQSEFPMLKGTNKKIYYKSQCKACLSDLHKYKRLAAKKKTAAEKLKPPSGNNLNNPPLKPIFTDYVPEEPYRRV